MSGKLGAHESARWRMRAHGKLGGTIQSVHIATDSNHKILPKTCATEPVVHFAVMRKVGFLSYLGCRQARLAFSDRFVQSFQYSRSVPMARQIISPDREIAPIGRNAKKLRRLSLPLALELILETVA